MDKIDKIEHKGGCSFFIHELIKNRYPCSRRKHNEKINRT